MWKPILFIVGFALVISLIASWIGLLISFIFAIPFANFIFGNTLLSSFAAASIFFVVAIPIIYLILLVAKPLFKKRINTTMQSGMMMFWVLNLVGLATFGSKFGWEFNQEEHVVQSEKILSFSQDTVSIGIVPESAHKSMINIDGIKIFDDNLVVDNIRIKLAQSASEDFRLIHQNRARGKNSAESSKLARAIEYEPVISENGILFPTEFIIKKGSKWRNQRVDLTLEIPKGKSIKLPDGYANVARHIRVDHAIEHPPVYLSKGQVWTMKEDSFYSKENAPQKIGEDRGFKDFKNINVTGPLKVNISKGEKFSVNVQGKGKYLKKVKMEQVGETLDIQLSNARYGSPVRLFVTAPDLARVDLEETDDVNISGFDGNKLDIINEGRHEVKAFVDVDSLYLNFSHNKSDIRGKGKYLKVKLDDGARLDAEHYITNNAFVKAERAGKIKLEVIDTLRHNLLRGSKIDFDDQPKVIIDDRQVKESSIDKQH